MRKPALASLILSFLISLSASLSIQGRTRFLEITEIAPNCTLDKTVIINKNTHLYGDILNIAPTGSLIIGSHTTVTLSGITLSPLLPHSIICTDNTSRLILENCTVLLTEDYSFNQGILEIKGETHISGPHQFIYRSPAVSRILKQSRLTIDPGCTFYYHPVSHEEQYYLSLDQEEETEEEEEILASQNTQNDTTGMLPLYSRAQRRFLLAERSSTLTCDNSTLRIGPAGMILTRGYLESNGTSFISTDSDRITRGLLCGNCRDSKENLEIYLIPPENPDDEVSKFKMLNGGHLVMRNIARSAGRDKLIVLAGTVGVLALIGLLLKVKTSRPDTMGIQ